MSIKTRAARLLIALPPDFVWLFPDSVIYEAMHIMNREIKEREQENRF
jgi:hypothetical protein